MRFPLIATVLLSFLATAQAGTSLEQWIAEDLGAARAAAGVSPLVRRPALDRVARERAAAIAALPHDRRMAYESPLEAALRAAEMKWIESATAHVDMLRGYASPAAGLLQNWRNYGQAWRGVMDPRLEAIGLGSATAADGWLIFVAVLVRELPAIDDVQAYERRVAQAINAVRDEHRLPPLELDERLSEVARRHSEDMARRDYFDHKSPDGQLPADRVLRAGLPFRSVGENIHMSRGRRDPLRAAVEGWMASRGHRRQILDAGYKQTGLGVFITDDATIYVTQLFFTPDGR